MIPPISTGLVCPIFAVLFSTQALAADPIRLEQPFVRVGDVVEVSLPITDALDEMLSLPLFKLEAGVERSFSNEVLHASLVRRVPGLKGRLTIHNTSTQTFIYEKPKVEQTNKCLKLSNDVAEGDPILRQNAVLSSNCGNLDRDLVSYNSTLQVYEVTQTLEAGTQIPVATAALLPLVVKGDEMTLKTQVGPVTVSRPVTLTESVFTSGPTHVRTSDGMILNAHLDLEGE